MLGWRKKECCSVVTLQVQQPPLYSHSYLHLKQNYTFSSRMKTNKIHFYQIGNNMLVKLVLYHVTGGQLNSH